MANNGGSAVGTGLIAGILIAALVVIAIIFVAGGFNFGGEKDINVDIEAPKIGAPEVPNPGGDGN